MKTLGIIGGIAPPSTVDYYGRLTARYRALSPGGSYPSLLINSVDATRIFPLLVAGDRPALIEAFSAEVGRLARGGADIGLFASNAVHVVFDEVAAASPIPLISIVEETAKVAEVAGYRTVRLIGARMTMDGTFYSDLFARRGMRIVTPWAEDRSYVHDRYMGELVEGVFHDETRAGISAVVEGMRDRDGIEAIILGGTELAVLYHGAAPVSVPMLDTTEIHVESAVARLLA
jgi:aspartate racemase